MCTESCLFVLTSLSTPDVFRESWKEVYALAADSAYFDLQLRTPELFLRCSKTRFLVLPVLLW